MSKYPLNFSDYETQVELEREKLEEMRRYGRGKM